MLSLQAFVTSSFTSWQPQPPHVVARTKYSVTLDWSQMMFSFLSQELLYRLERKDKLCGWLVQYCGSKTVKELYNLGPCIPHTFRIRVILRTGAVSRLAHTAVEHFRTEHAVYQHLTFKHYDAMVGKTNEEVEIQENMNVEEVDKTSGDKIDKEGEDPIFFKHFKEKPKDKESHKGDGDTEELNVEVKEQVVVKTGAMKPWLESQWSDESWASTEAEGQSAASFCLAVRGGYTKQVQTMLEERPALLEMINTTNGYTPLATAALKGDVNMVKLVLCAGADVDGVSANNRTALHVALLAGHVDLAGVLLDHGAQIQVRDVIGLRGEHCAVDGGSIDALHEVLSRGGDLNVTDHNGWTPLFRAVVGDASTPMIEELIKAGSDVNVADNAGLTLLAAARVMRGQSGSRRQSALRALDATYPHEVAADNYIRLTRKICTLNTATKHE